MTPSSLSIKPYAYQLVMAQLAAEFIYAGLYVIILCKVWYLNLPFWITIVAHSG